jgi:PST family polysaccharide transporter
MHAPEGGAGARLRAVLHSRITQNAIALSASQFLLTALPLITIPWLARALGAAELGEVLYVQSFAWLLAMIGEYGFRISGTRAVARVRDDPQRLQDTVAGVLGAKLLLVVLVTAIALAALVLVPRFRDDPGLLVLGWLIGVLMGLEPLWFFAGVERLRVTAAMDAGLRVLTAIAIVALIREPGQGKLVLAIWAASFFVSTVGLSIVMFRSVRPRRPRLRAGIAALREGWPLFVNVAAVSLYTAGTVFVLGFVATNPQLAIFGSAERIIRAAIRSLSPVGSAAFPRITYLLESGRSDRAQRLASIALAALGTIATLMALALFALAPVIVDVLFGAGFEPVTSVLRVLTLLLPLVAISSTLVALWLLAHGFDTTALWISVAAGVANVVLVVAIGASAGALGAAWVLVGIEAGVMIATAAAIHRRRLFPTLAQALGRPAPEPR